ncbi:zinc ribbon domain-containing protein [Evansella cellulosilytica]|uniref:Zinc-ribbon domain-containing protein n=1 Tax=Evansella cellulosilytica (strain ATCC 21833 / DSM 2522 / FERM P-1141 / JCM 9156 / N-4) TaxID=649639 RepID=E6TTW1_EVAC2|nr:zinc ribbon domain-containing protein [Evansella cellulosilytica]ADU31992.1 hypothetical protein Bcell_3752 [Evansella cellulosilytica DSM 2522]
MFCSSCGSKVREGSNFCVKCGAKVKSPIQENTGISPTPKVVNNNTSAETPAPPAKQTNQESYAVVYIVLGWVFFAISLLFIPPLFGVGAFVMGLLLYRTGADTHGIIMMVLSAVGTVFGMFLGLLFTFL